MLLLVGLRWFWGLRGGRSWGELVGLVPDLVPWLLAVAALVFMSGVARALLVLRAV